MRGLSMRTSLLWSYFPSTTWVLMPKAITSSSFPNFLILQARPWLVPWGAESWFGLARTPWVLGFFSGRGKPLALWGRTGERPLEKRERGLPELLTVLAVILKENYLLDPCVVSGTRSGECRFSSGKICARANGPPERKPPLRGSTRESGALDAEEASLPFHGAI